MENFENKNTFEYWNKVVQRLEGELEIAKEKRDSFGNQNKNPEGQIEKRVEGYLKGKSGKMFNRLENNQENSFFKLFNVNGDIGYFEFSGNDAEAIAKRVFGDDICNIVSGGYQTGRSVRTIKPGKVKRVGDGWEVIERAEIELK
jgi:hypothetical protein